MAWTVISDATLEVGKALRALTMRNLRDNIAAVAAGSAGAPQIQTAAIAAGAVTAAKIAAGNVLAANIADGNVTTSKIADGNVTTGKIATGAVAAWVASLGTGAVGSYAYLKGVSSVSYFEGNSYAGSGLAYSGVNSAGTLRQGGTPAGTWLCMGSSTASGGSLQSTLFLRIA